MVVSCSKCGTKFKIADDKISASGVKVRCSKCKHTFVVSTAGVTEVDAPASKPTAKEAKDSAAGSVPPPPASVTGAAPPVPPPPPNAISGVAPVPPPPPNAVSAAGSVPPPPASAASTPGSVPPPPASTPGSVPPPPASPEVPLPPPPKVVEKAAASEPAGFPAPAVEPGGSDDSLPDDIFSSPTKVGPAPTDDAPPLGDLPLPPPPPDAPNSAFGQPPGVAKGAAEAAIPDVPLAAADSLPASTQAPLGEDPFAASMSDGPTERVDSPAGQEGALSEELGEGLFADLDAAVDQTLGQESPSAAMPPDDLSAPPPPPPPQAGSVSGGAELDGAASESIPGLEVATPGGPIEGGPEASAPVGDDPFAGVDLDVPEGPANDAPQLTNSAADFMTEAALANPPEPEVPPAPEAPEPAAAAYGADPADPFAGIDVNAGASPSAAETTSSDPFADIDVNAGAAAPGASSPSADPFADISLDASPAAGEQPAASPAPATGGMFDNLGDPFAGVGDPSEQPAGASDEPPPLPTQDGAGSDGAGADGGGAGADLFGPDEMQMEEGGLTPGAGGAGTGEAGADPFAALDTSVPAGGGTDGMDRAIGHDPFSGLETVDEGMPADDGPDLGLAMDADGSLGGQEIPAPPPSTKAMGGPEQAQAEDAPQVVQRPPGPPPMAPVVVPEDAGRTSLPVKIGFGLVLLVLALFVFVVYRHGGKPDLTKWSTYVEAFTGDGGDVAVAGDMIARGLSSTSYPNRDGHAVVMLWGQVENTAQDTKAGIVVRGQLLDADDAVLQEQVVPAGVTFSPQDVHAMVDSHSVGDAYRAGYPEAPKELAPGESLPFTVVMFEHPNQLAEVRVRVIPAESDKPLGELPAPAPPPADEEAAAAGDDDVEPVALPAKEKPAVKHPKAGVRAAKADQKRGTVVKLGPKGQPDASRTDPP